LLENVCKYYKTKILVINDLTDKSYEQELTEDLISIIHYFSMKSYSNRRKLNKIKKELEQESLENN
jgi:predicted site-specific integrase-resolvase